LGAPCPAVAGGGIVTGCIIVIGALPLAPPVPGFALIAGAGGGTDPGAAAMLPAAAPLVSSPSLAPEPEQAINRVIAMIQVVSRIVLTITIPGGSSAELHPHLATMLACRSKGGPLHPFAMAWRASAGARIEAMQRGDESYAQLEYALKSRALTSPSAPRLRARARLRDRCR